MQCQFIATRKTATRSLKLFRVGEYQYEICELRKGCFKRIRLLTNVELEQALDIFKEIK